jgi:hypothetical protein
MLDVDRTLWMLAFNDVLVNLDSYSGAFRQNYYLYRDHANQWIPTVWDVNMSYGGFIMNGITQLTLSQMQQMAPDLHINDANWPLIRKLLSNAMYKKMYLAHLRTINNENFLNQDYKILIGQLRMMIDTLVQNDPHFLYSYTQYQNSLTSATGTGMGSAPVYGLMDTRATWLSNNALLTPPPPFISNVSANPMAPSYLDTFFITASVTGAPTLFGSVTGTRSRIDSSAAGCMMTDYMGTASLQTAYLEYLSLQARLRYSTMYMQRMHQ